MAGLPPVVDYFTRGAFPFRSRPTRWATRPLAPMRGIDRDHSSYLGTHPPSISAADREDKGMIAIVVEHADRDVAIERRAPNRLPVGHSPQSRAKTSVALISINIADRQLWRPTYDGLDGPPRLGAYSLGADAVMRCDDGEVRRAKEPRALPALVGDSDGGS